MKGFFGPNMNVSKPCLHRPWNMILFSTIWTLLLLVKHGTCQQPISKDFYIMEELEEGTVIGTVEEPSAPPPYMFYNPDGTGNRNNLTYSANSGVIKVGPGGIDREVQSQLSLVAVATSTGKSVHITIHVEDINDHQPTFQHNFESKQLSEKTPKDVKIPLGSAVDPDLGTNSTQRYEIVSGNTNNVFRVVSKRATNGILYLDLQIKELLDYETTPSYSLVINAFDGGTPPKIGTKQVNITLIDVNDNQPIFQQSRYFSQVAENATVRTSVMQVAATDRDSGENGQIRYQIDRRNDQQETFDIDPETGIVFVNKQLDYEKHQAYELIVVAKDNGAQPLQTTAIVSVTVLDINDNAPVIDLTFLTDDGTGRIPESAVAGDKVARISVTDPDIPLDSDEETAGISVTIQGGEGHFEISTRESVLYLVLRSKPLDRENKPYYELVVTATDSGIPPLQTNLTITLSITDSNDNPPQFTKQTYYAEIQEVVPPGSSVIQLTAVDHDSGNNSMISYKLKHTPNTHSDWFHIDNRTGLITTRSRVDCETASEPKLTVIAMDSGLPPLSSTATVIIQILDVNDNQPVFDQSFYNVSVSEATGVNTCILTVSASDPDCGIVAKLTYSIATNLGFPTPEEFEIQAETGKICIVNALDHETKSSYEFAVLAKDQDDLETNAIVKITVTDENDNRPVFYPTRYSVNVREDDTVGKEVVVVQASDADSGQNGQVGYRIVAGNTERYFSIIATTGVIKIAKDLDTSISMFSITVEAFDGQGRTSATNAHIDVSVIGPSQVPPIFNSALYRFQVSEDASNSLPVGQVSAVTTSGDSIQYSIASGNTENYFSIHPGTGVISIIGVLDHDEVPFVLLTVQAKSGAPPSFGKAQANISITDVNDNSPEFSVRSIEIPVKEDTALSDTLYIVHATDKDSGLNGEIRFSLQDTTGTLSINAVTGEVRLLKQLDYEEKPQHEVIITASDRGNPSKSSTLNLIIDVQDTNDNVPVFSQSVYSVEVEEAVPISSKLAQVRADDMDEGNNGRVVYRLDTSVDAQAFGIFSDDGFLYNRIHLDREKQERYNLVVIATDNGIPPRSSMAEIIVSVLDANDNRPQFSESSYTFYVEENRPVGTHAGYVSAVDNDQSENLEYSLVGSNTFFAVNPRSGEITTKQMLDRETKVDHTFTVQVSDGGSPPQSSNVDVLIRIRDINDNAPMFEQRNPVKTEIKENQPKNTRVIQVSALDTDQGESAVVTYSFDTSTPDSIAFSIHPTTGVITTNQVLDHETKDSYTFNVIAQDNGNPKMSSSITIELDVEDLNESPPVFETSRLSLDVQENTAPGSVVGSVKAIDKDSGENGRVFYYVVSGNLFGTFGVNGTNGDIIVSRPVDFEMCAIYSIGIRAVDNSNINPMSSTINVNITVIDLNDNAPVFEDNPLVISVRENSEIGSVAYTVRAMDMDSGSNGKVHYTILSQNPDEEWFEIEAASGRMIVTKDLDFESLTQITLSIRAEDQATSPSKRLTTTLTAVIMIEDVNDNSPIFQTRTRVDIMEDEPQGYPVLHMIATDADSYLNGQVSYSIVAGNTHGHFNLHSDTGLLSIAKMLDRETTPEFRLNITAKDHGYPRRASFMMLRVVVVDVNDNPPIFQRSVYTADITENTDIHALVTDILASDADEGDNAKLIYQIPFGIADNKFEMGERTGRISTKASLDREMQESWVITAYVKDDAFPALYDTTTVIVNVEDENDNAPIFNDKVYNLDVPENANLSVIHTVVATDLDAGVFGEITYSIIGGDVNNKFSIESTTGRLSCRPLNREAESQYNLTIQARDGGSPSLTSTSSLLIHVLDENDNDPVFQQSSYARTISEDFGIGDSVLTVTAEDADEGVNKKISYSITNDAEGQFKINNITGLITSAGQFDREKKASYIFEVYAIDGGLYGPRSEKVRVEITISDINDNAPVFEEIPYKANISADHGINNYVTKVKAVDKDEGINKEVTYRFKTSSLYFEINSISGAISTKQNFGLNAVNVHRLIVIAEDAGSPQKSSEGVVEIRVGNAEGTGTLRFSNLTYNVYLAENSGRASSVVTVQARFVSGGSGSISYSFADGNEYNTFTIDSSTGYITVNDPTRLDYESHTRLRLIVVATANNAYGYTTVWINLKDVNDNKPKFTQERYTSAVWEGNSRGTYVTQIRASDADEGENGRVMYTIISGNTHNAFVIDPPNTGIVKTNIILDREIRDSYKLVIEAVDNGKNYQTSTCNLRIQVIDSNDNAPFFPTYRDVDVWEGTDLGTVVLQVTANDVDLNPVLTYDFSTEGNPDGAFSIDRYSGKIVIAKKLDYEQRSNYKLKVEASDQTHTAMTEININLMDENDNPPVFSQQSYQVSLPEMTPAHFSVITVNATDKDAGANSNVTYSMLVVDGFYINTSTGTIYTNRTVLFNPSQHTIHIVVTAQDHGEPALSAVVAVRVQVIDINNHAPVFSENIYNGDVSEDEERGATILQVAADDGDDSYENKKIDYSIIEGNNNQVFQISSSTGEIILVGELDRESVISYNLKINAKDRGDPPLSSTCEVSILVTDVNDNPPQFSQSEYKATVNESIAVNSKVLLVQATDRDAGENGLIQYRIQSGNEDNRFDIDRDSGYIRVRSELDHEKCKEHKLIIKATDSSSTTDKLSSYATVIIDVTDVNEFTPRFPVMMYIESVIENARVGTTVFTAFANDNDGGNYGKVTYRLNNANGFFHINSTTGVVTTGVIFDFENKESYTFSVMALDIGGEYATVPVMVKIDQYIDFTPSFSKTSYDFEVPGNAKKGHIVGTISAEDTENVKPGLVNYFLKEDHEYFAINRTTGVLFVSKDLQYVEEAETEGTREKRRAHRVTRALAENRTTLVVVASSGGVQPKEATTTIEMDIDRTCAGCQVLGAPVTGAKNSFSLSGTPLVLVIVFAIIAVVLVLIIVIMYLRGREKKRRPPDQPRYDSSFDSMDIHMPSDTAPPTYNEVSRYPTHIHGNTMTTSEMSDQSHSASSGRGSADMNDEDEEIRMINATPLNAQGLRMPDSGIQQDEDAISEHSVHNHQEYLARLGIDSSKIKVSSSIKPSAAASVESMHQFSDEGGGEGDGMDVGNLVYNKLGEATAAENGAAMDGTRQFAYTGAEPSNAGSLSSVINSEEEFSGSYNWDYLLDWGPQYQPLADVFSEIARLKDDSIKPKKAPTKIVPQHRNGGIVLNPHARTDIPPPIITNAPPRAVLAHPMSTRASHTGSSSSSSSISNANSARTSQLTSMPTLPRSPISHESSFTSPALSPSFTPSLSPLATRSPSISPIISTKGIGSSAHSVSSGHTTPPRGGRRHMNGGIRSYKSGGSSISESEQEIHI